MEFTVGSSNQAVMKLPAKPVARSVRPSPKRTVCRRGREGVRASGGPDADLVAAVAGRARCITPQFGPLGGPVSRPERANFEATVRGRK